MPLIHILKTGRTIAFLQVLIPFARIRHRCPLTSSLKLGADTPRIPVGSAPSSNYHIQLFRSYYSDNVDLNACVYTQRVIRIPNPSIQSPLDPVTPAMV